MTTFGNPYDNQYHATSVQSGKSKRAAEKNQKEARNQKKAKARGNSVSKGSKHGDDERGGRGGGRGRGRGSRGGRGGRGGGGGGGGGSADFGSGMLLFIQIVCLAAALGQLAVGLIHMINLFESLEDLCDEDIDQLSCVGGVCIIYIIILAHISYVIIIIYTESLFFDIEDVNGDSTCLYATSVASYDVTTCDEDNVGYSSVLNSPWRSNVFSLVPDIFIDNWTPLIFGIIAVLQCIGGFQSDWISGSLLKVLIFHIVMMLFACFGYSGQAGIIVGFIQALAGFLVLIAMFMKVGGYAYPTFYLCC